MNARHPEPWQYGALDADSLARVAELLTDAVKVRYGDRLTDNQLAEVRAGLLVHLTAGEALHRFPLTNADEPVFVFVPEEEEQ